MALASRLFASIAFCLALAGCITSSEQLAQRDNDRCVARGHQPNTDKFAECLKLVESERIERMERNRRDNMERSASPLLR